MVTSACKAGSAHTLRCERVHFGHFSMPRSQSGSLPPGFSPAPIRLRPFCLLYDPTPPVFQATLLTVYNQRFSVYFQSHLLRCGNFPDFLRHILPPPPLQSMNAPNPCFYVLLQSLQATHMKLNPLNLFCLSTLGQAA